MIVTCPVCRTRYRVAEPELDRPAGRRVRCVACGHVWSHAPPAREPLPPPAVPRIEPPLGMPPRPAGVTLATPPRSAVVAPPAPRRRQWVAAAAVVMIMLVVLAALIAVIAREEIAAAWPPAAQFFAWIGLTAR